VPTSSFSYIHLSLKNCSGRLCVYLYFSNTAYIPHRNHFFVTKGPSSLFFAFPSTSPFSNSQSKPQCSHNSGYGTLFLLSIPWPISGISYREHCVQYRRNVPENTDKSGTRRKRSTFRNTAKTRLTTHTGEIHDGNIKSITDTKNKRKGKQHYRYASLNNGDTFCEMRR
jgi:hypothetical protein